MKSIRLLFVLLLCSLAANAQEIKRIEIPIAGQLETFSIPLGEKGVIVLTQVGKSEFNIRKFNTNLEQVWMNQGSIEANLDFYTYYSVDLKATIITSFVLTRLTVN